MSTIILIRHAQAGGHDAADPPLSATGERESELLAARLRGTRVDAILLIGSFVGHALGAPADAWLRLPIANASITELQSRPHREWAVARVSDTGHLPHV